jgi:protein deglycase
MGTVYVFFADGFEEIEAFTSVDVMRRAGLNVEMITVTPDEIVKGAHGVPVLCDKNIVNCDFFDADLILLPGGMPGAATLEKCDDLRRLILRFAEENKPIAAICAAPMVLGNNVHQQRTCQSYIFSFLLPIHRSDLRFSYLRLTPFTYSQAGV